MSKKTLSLWITVLALSLTAALPALAEDAPGKEKFEAAKCHLCHAVSTVGIEAKTKSAAMLGPDLVDLEIEAEKIVLYLKQEGALEGKKKHKKKWTGSDDDVKAIVEWILAQKTDG